MRKNKLFLISLGCDKNRVDSERMLGFLEDAGFSFTDDENDVKILLFNILIDRNHSGNGCDENKRELQKAGCVRMSAGTL